ncbi:hypothetical protein ACWD0Z_39200 [Streptomyces sp. NPDC003007]
MNEYRSTTWALGKRVKLAAWTDHGDLHDTPLISAALTTHFAPTRP